MNFEGHWISLRSLEVGAMNFGGHLSQQQHAFPVDGKTKVAQVARKALIELISGRDSQTTGHSRRDTNVAQLPFKELFQGAIAANPTALKQLLTTLKKKGYSDARLVFDVIPVVARDLGKAWERDEISFVDVTIGCARLQHEVHNLTDEADDAALVPASQRRDCLVLLPAGAQHTLGATILAKQLRHAGMRVSQDLEATSDTVLTLAKYLRFDAVFISASLSESSDILRQLVDVSRQQWPDSKVVLGGSFQGYGPEITARIGADHVTQDWQDALDLCN